MIRVVNRVVSVRGSLESIHTQDITKQVLGEKYAWFQAVTVEEFLAYLSLCILMGLVQLPKLEDYWRRDEYLRYTPISDQISRDRFRESTTTAWRPWI